MMHEGPEDEKRITHNRYKCGHCGYEGPCYGNGFSAPWCYKCQMNNKLTKLNVHPESAADGD